jgi:hypothetical protein
MPLPPDNGRQDSDEQQHHYDTLDDHINDIKRSIHRDLRRHINRINMFVAWRLFLLDRPLQLFTLFFTSLAIYSIRMSYGESDVYFGSMLSSLVALTAVAVLYLIMWVLKVFVDINEAYCRDFMYDFRKYRVVIVSLVQPVALPSQTDIDTMIDDVLVERLAALANRGHAVVGVEDFRDTILNLHGHVIRTWSIQLLASQRVYVVAQL